MALTIVNGENGYTVLFDGATAFDQATNTDLTNKLPNGKSIKSIQVVPSALDDVFTVREGSASGRIIMKIKAVSEYDQRIKYFNDKADKKHKLFVVGAEASSGVMMIVET
jgi:hypothetical protein